MPLVNMRVLLKQAQAENRAVGAFSVANLEMLIGAVKAAQAQNTPIIVQIAEARLGLISLETIGPAMIAAAKLATVPLAVHLDHGLTLPCIRRALELGFTSVMFDGSALPMDENIAITREVMAMAAQTGAAVEAEVGTMGRSEDGIAGKAVCATAGDALYFMEKTNVDALAVAIGNSHGIYAGVPVLRFDVLEEIKRQSNTPLVFHGGTGISQEDFQKLIRLGMHKINIATASFQAAARAAHLPPVDDIFEVSQHMANATYETVNGYLRIFQNR